MSSSVIKRISRVLGAVLCAVIVFGIAASGGPYDGGKTALFDFDTRGGTVQSALQRVTGQLNPKQDITEVTYRVYADIDNGALSAEGDAALTADGFVLDDLRLKPDGNKVVVTARSADGKTQEKNLRLHYDSARLKEVTARDVAKVSAEDDMFYVKNNLLVYFEPDTDEAARNNILRAVNGRRVGYDNGIHMWQVEVASSSIEDLQTMADRLMLEDGVSYATFNLAEPAKSMLIPNDPWYNNGSPAWNELNPNGGNWSVEAIQALSAWDYQHMYTRIRVGIVDDGFQTDHPDLTGKILFPDAQSAADNKVSDHGSHVAGIIGAIPNNGIGVTGILWDTMMYCFNWDTPLSTDATIYSGLSKTVQAGAKVVNFSLGSYYDLSQYGPPSSNTYVKSYATQSGVAMKTLLDGGYEFIVVQSAGNGQNGYAQDAIYNGYFCSVTFTNLPGSYSSEMRTKINERILIVGAAQRVGALQFQQAQFSNGGAQVDICAPGYDVYSCYGNSSYWYMSGTSMSAPVAAGVAALTWSVNPSLTGSQVRAILIDPNNTPYVVADNTSSYHPPTDTYRMVNAKLSVEAAAATMNPDYTAVDAAVAAAQQRNPDLYTTASWSNLTAALNAVDYTLPYLYQPEIDAMAQNINNAIAALVLKTVSYTVEYRLGSESGTKLIADKTGSGSVTTVVNETAAAITGYFAPTATKSITLSLSENKLVFVYFDKPGFSLKLETYKDVGGTPIKTDAVQPGDIITVRVTPTTDFFCGASRFIVMYDKSFYSIVGTGNAAFTPNTANPYYANTVTGYSGITNSPSNAWPDTFSQAEKDAYNFTSTTFTALNTSANGGFPTVMNTGDWLFSFRLQVKPDATGTGRIFMDNRWTRNSTYNGSQYFFWCESGTVPNSSGNGSVDYNTDFALADIVTEIRAQVTVSFDLNGGNGTAPAPLVGTPGDAAALPDGSTVQKEHFIFAGWAWTPDAAEPLGAFVFPAESGVLYAVWNRMPIQLSPLNGTVIDEERGYIYGLVPGITKTVFENERVALTGNASLIIHADHRLGTGTKVEVFDEHTQSVVATYYIIIFGDVNGDGVADSVDADILVEVENYRIDWAGPLNDLLRFAGDINRDGSIGATDADILREAENFMLTINQTDGTFLVLP